MVQVSDAEAAKIVSEKMNEAFHSIGDALVAVRERCSAEEADVFGSKCGDLFYEITFKVLEPLYAQHPALRPDNWDDRPPVGPE